MKGQSLEIGVGSVNLKLVDGVFDRGAEALALATNGYWTTLR